MFMSRFKQLIVQRTELIIILMIEMAANEKFKLQWVTYAIFCLCAIQQSL